MNALSDKHKKGGFLTLLHIAEMDVLSLATSTSLESESPREGDIIDSGRCIFICQAYLIYLDLIERKISSGGFGRVFECLDRKRMQLSAIKVFNFAHSNKQSADKEYRFLLWLRRNQPSTKSAKTICKPLSV